MNNFLRHLFLSSSLLVSPMTQALPLDNLGFELGNLTGYVASNGASVVNSWEGLPPSEGQYMALLRPDTDFYASDYGAITLNPGLGSPSAAIMSTYLDLNDGENLSFNWAFFGHDQIHVNDFSLFAAGLEINLLGDIGSSWMSGWQSFIFSPQGGYHGEVSWIVSNQYWSYNDSYLAIDNLQIGANTVPEPATVGLLAIGLLGLGGVKRKALGSSSKR